MTAFVRTVRKGSKGAPVALVQEFLASYPPIALKAKRPGEFCAATEVAVLEFQARRDLEIDGVVGPITWAAMFGVPDQAPAIGWQGQFLRLLAGEVGVREIGHNRGPRIEMYQDAAGLTPGKAGREPYCLAFAYWGAQQTTRITGVRHDLLKTAHCMTLWRHAQRKGQAIPAIEARPGDILLMRFSGDRGHAAVCEKNAAGRFVTIEANTDGDGVRDGDGVYRKTTRRYTQFVGAVRIPLLKGAA